MSKEVQHTYLDLMDELWALIHAGEGEGELAETKRELMDGRWNYMDEEEQKYCREASSQRARGIGMGVGRNKHKKPSILSCCQGEHTFGEGCLAKQPIVHEVIGEAWVNPKALEKLVLWPDAEQVSAAEFAENLGLPEGTEAWVEKHSTTFESASVDVVAAALRVPKELLRPTSASLRWDKDLVGLLTPLEPRDICVCLHSADQHKWLNDPAPLRSRHLRCTVCDCGHFRERGT